MTGKAKRSLSKLESGLQDAMRAIDGQVAREMQRTPAERERSGVQKWEPIERRIESLTPFILNSIGDEETTLDSLLVLLQSFSKSLKILTEDLGPEGLGAIRTEYIKRCADNVERDMQGVGDALGTRQSMA